MMIVTAKMPKRRNLLLGAILMLTVLIAAFVLLRRPAAPESTEPSLQAETNEQRVAYLESLGWEVEAEPVETLRLSLPEQLAEPYLSYNELQRKQGFDLTPCLGKTLERCTYRVTNYPGRSSGCQADLYVCDGMIVAGDIVCTGANGFIDTLEFPT
ncbi:MAG: DUF4830 domain-containing protein [Oscillospiraceae bacterium]|nr:DUF4830 domain-containing protein [Oscillospiraceae bacterium]